MKVVNIDVSKITVPEVRVTAVYDEEKTELLSGTIEALGVLSPITVVKVGEDYRLVDGLHRLYVSSKFDVNVLRYNNIETFSRFKVQQLGKIKISHVKVIVCIDQQRPVIGFLGLYLQELSL